MLTNTNGSRMCVLHRAKPISPKLTNKNQPTTTTQATTRTCNHKPHNTQTPKGRKTGKNTLCLKKLQQFQSNLNSNHGEV